MLEEAKLVDRVHDSDGRARYEVQHERPHHDHLVCVPMRIASKKIQWPQIEKIQDKTCKDLGVPTDFSTDTKYSATAKIVDGKKRRDRRNGEEK